MEFRPCIDIHNGSVKQIVGGSLRDQGDLATENFVSDQDAAFYAKLYRSLDLKHGHIVLLNPPSSPYYEATMHQAAAALKAWPGGLQIGGGIHDENAIAFLELGASHVIVTSFLFKNGLLSEDRLRRIQKAVGKERLVLDLSCRKRGEDYFIVTDRWQTFTQAKITPALLMQLTSYCDEFLIHAADVEGKSTGIEIELVDLLSEIDGFPITYAGGIGSFADLELLRQHGKNKLHATVGSALDLFDGSMPLEEVVAFCK